MDSFRLDPSPVHTHASHLWLVIAPIHTSDGMASSRRDRQELPGLPPRRRQKTSRRALRCLRDKRCYFALLLGSVLANVVQLVAFFLSQPAVAKSFTLSAPYHAIVGALISKRRMNVAPSTNSDDSRGLRRGIATTSGDRTLEASPGVMWHPVELAEEAERAAPNSAATTATRPALDVSAGPSHPVNEPAVIGGTQQRVDALPARHPVYRLAFTVPWIGSTFPSWFPYFLSSCNRSAFLADWLIFHESAELPSSSEVPANVIFHDLGEGGLGHLFGTRIAAALGRWEETERLVALFRTAFREFAYIVTEYKPTHGAVFASYLVNYSHWSYTDIDMLIGDMPLHVELDELESYDIFTYHFGDVFRLYLRGQVSPHPAFSSLAHPRTAPFTFCHLPSSHLLPVCGTPQCAARQHALGGVSTPWQRACRRARG